MLTTMELVHTFGELNSNLYVGGNMEGFKSFDAMENVRIRRGKTYIKHNQAMN